MRPAQQALSPWLVLGPSSFERMLKGVGMDECSEDQSREGLALSVPRAGPWGPSQGHWSAVYWKAQTLSRNVGVSLSLLVTMEECRPRTALASREI